MNEVIFFAIVGKLDCTQIPKMSSPNSNGCAVIQGCSTKDAR